MLYFVRRQLEACDGYLHLHTLQMNYDNSADVARIRAMLEQLKTEHFSKVGRSLPCLAIVASFSHVVSVTRYELV